MLCQSVIGLTYAPPLAALPFEAVHMKGSRHSGPLENGYEEAVGSVEDDRRVDGLATCVEDRQEGMAERLELLLLQRRTLHHVDSAPGIDAPLVRPVVHNHVVTTVDETKRHFFDRGLETSVAGRNTSGPDHGESQTFPLWPVKSQQNFATAGLVVTTLVVLSPHDGVTTGVP